MDRRMFDDPKPEFEDKDTGGCLLGIAFCLFWGIIWFFQNCQG